MGDAAAHEATNRNREATLYVVATPIGNLRDVSLRALDVLKHVDAIAAEDTRITRRLLARYGIAGRLIPVHEHNERRAVTRVLALLNIVGTGMGGGNDVEQNTDDMDPKATAKVATENKEHVVGIKSAHFTAPNWTSVDRALEAAKLAAIPLMVDFGRFQPERPFEELVTKRLRPGDIYTHTYLAAVPMLDDHGKVRPYLFKARKRGVTTR